MECYHQGTESRLERHFRVKFQPFENAKKSVSSSPHKHNSASPITSVPLQDFQYYTLASTPKEYSHRERGEPF